MLGILCKLVVIILFPLVSLKWLRLFRILWYGMSNMIETQTPTSTPNPEAPKNPENEGVSADYFAANQEIQASRDRSEAEKAQAIDEVHQLAVAAAKKLEDARAPLQLAQDGVKTTAGLAVATAASFGAMHLVADGVDANLEYRGETGQNVQEMVDQSDQDLEFQQGLENGSVTIQVPEPAEQIPSPVQQEQNDNQPTIPSPVQKDAPGVGPLPGN